MTKVVRISTEISENNIKAFLLGPIKTTNDNKVEPTDNGFFLEKQKGDFKAVYYEPAEILGAISNIDNFPKPGVRLDDIPGNFLTKRLRLARHRRFEKRVARTVKNWVNYREKSGMLDHAGESIETQYMSDDARRIYNHVSKLLQDYAKYLDEAKKLPKYKIGKEEGASLSTKDKNQRKQNWRTMSSLISKDSLFKRIQNWFLRKLKPIRPDSRYPVMTLELKGTKSSAKVVGALEEEEAFTSPLEKFLDEGLAEMEFEKSLDEKDILKVQDALGISRDDVLLLKDVMPKRVSREEKDLSAQAIASEQTLFAQLLSALKNAKAGAKYAPKRSILQGRLELFEMYCSYRRNYFNNMDKPEERLAALRSLVNFQNEILPQIYPEIYHIKRLSEIGQGLLPDEKINAIHDDILLNQFAIKGDGHDWVGGLYKKYRGLNYFPAYINDCKEGIEKAYNEVVGENITNAEVKDISQLYKKVRRDKIDRMFGRESKIYNEINQRLDEWENMRVAKGLKEPIEDSDSIDDEVEEKYVELLEILSLLEHYERAKVHVRFPAVYHMSGVTALINLRAAQKELGRYIGTSKQKRTPFVRVARKFAGGVRKAKEGVRQGAKGVRRRITEALRTKAERNKAILTEGAEEAYQKFLEGEKQSLFKAMKEELDQHGDEYEIEETTLSMVLPETGVMYNEASEDEDDIGLEHPEENQLDLLVDVPQYDGDELLSMVYKAGKDFHLFAHAYHIEKTPNQPSFCSLSSNFGSAIVSVAEDGSLRFQVEVSHPDFYENIPSFIQELCEKQGWSMNEVKVKIPLDDVQIDSKVNAHARGFVKGFVEKNIAVEDFDFSEFGMGVERNELERKNDELLSSGLKKDLH